MGSTNITRILVHVPTAIAKMVPRFSASRGLASTFRQFSTSASSLAPREGPAPPRRSTTATLLNLNNSQKPDTRRGDAAQRIVQSTRARQDASSANIYALTEANKQRRQAEEYMKDMPRHWVPGDVYSPRGEDGQASDWHGSVPQYTPAPRDVQQEVVPGSEAGAGTLGQLGAHSCMMDGNVQQLGLLCTSIDTYTC